MPSAVRFPAGSPGGPLSSGWLDPGCKYVCLLVPGIEKDLCVHHKDAFTWPSAQQPFHEVFSLAAWKTGSCEFLRPLKNAVDMWTELQQSEPSWNGRSTIGKVGSEEWAQSQALSQAKSAILKHKMFTDGADTDYDSVLIEMFKDDAYTRYLLENTYSLDFGSPSSFSAVASSIASSLHGFEYNLPSITSEVRFTDRMFKFYKYAKYQKVRCGLFSSTLIDGPITDTSARRSTRPSTKPPTPPPSTRRPREMSFLRTMPASRR